MRGEEGVTGRTGGGEGRKGGMRAGRRGEGKGEGEAGNLAPTVIYKSRRLCTRRRPALDAAVEFSFLVTGI